MIGAIVLAAGESRRMGTQKLLLPYGGKTVIERVVDQVLRSKVDLTVVVTGADHAAIEAQLAGRPVTFACNSDCQNGMLSSVRCGLQAMPQGISAFIVVLGDQPAIVPALIDSLIYKSSVEPAGIVVPAYNGKMGHPILFPSRFCDTVMTKYDDSGLRGLIRDFPDQVCKVAWNSSCVLRDMDTPDDYNRELRLVSGGTMTHASEISERLHAERESILTIASRHGVSSVQIIGSVARGEDREGSDIDLLVDVTGPATPWFPGGLISELEELLGRSVDIVERRALNRDIREQILTEAKPL